ncbi:MAG: alpha/beta hydrolase [Akkermansiaceae bacterium]
MKVRKILLGTWSWRRPFYSFIGIYLLLLFCVLLGADALIFQPPRGKFEKPNDHFSLIPSPSDGTISTYYREPAGGMPVLLWSHGNAEDLRYLYPLLDDLNAFGFGVFAYDYPGYGLSSGKPTERGCFDAIENCYEELIHRKNTPAGRIIAVGQSVGSGPTCWLAEKKELAGVVLIAPFTSTFRTVTRVPLFPCDRFVNIDRIANIKQPTLFIHGTSDFVVPHWNSQELFETSGSMDKELLSLQNAGHNNLWSLHSDTLLLKLEDFSAKVYERTP